MCWRLSRCSIAEMGTLTCDPLAAQASDGRLSVDEHCARLILPAKRDLPMGSPLVGTPVSSEGTR